MCVISVNDTVLAERANMLINRGIGTRIVDETRNSLIWDIDTATKAIADGAIACVGRERLLGDINSYLIGYRFPGQPVLEESLRNNFIAI